MKFHNKRKKIIKEKKTGKLILPNCFKIGDIIIPKMVFLNNNWGFGVIVDIVDGVAHVLTSKVNLVHYNYNSLPIIFKVYENK